MSAIVIPFPARGRYAEPLPIPCDPTTERMARDILDHLRVSPVTTPLALSAHLADRDWDCEQIARHLHAAYAVARAERGACP